MSALTNNSTRNLGALQKTASTSRVLNLLAVADQHRAVPEHRRDPFFNTLALNESIIVKHRLRPDERSAQSGGKNVVTKVILPFDRSDLILGGKSFFVGQRGWAGMIQELAGEAENTDRDMAVLSALDTIPSLDPFILREHLTRHGFSIASTYFSISTADVTRMHAFVVAEICNLINMAFPNEPEQHYRKMANALLATKIDERLEPLRSVLRLDPHTYREGIFSWKGFLYYKWALADLAPSLIRVLKELHQLRPIESGRPGLKERIDSSRTNLLKSIQRRHREVTEAIRVYDDAYADLTVNKKPQALRDFLTNAPAMFMVLGERVGSISHLASFWRYRFQSPQSLLAPAEEVLGILMEFEADLNISETMAAAFSGNKAWWKSQTSA